VAIASLQITAAALNQYSGFKSLECRTMFRLQENHSLTWIIRFPHLSHSICKVRRFILFSYFGCGPNVHAKTLGAKALASRKLCRFPRKVIIKIV
jgi:hypothetical protein